MDIDVQVRGVQGIKNSRGSVIGYLCSGSTEDLYDEIDFVGFTVDTVTGKSILRDVRSGDHPTVTVTWHYVVYGCPDWCGYEDLHDEELRDKLRKARVARWRRAVHKAGLS